MSINGGTARNHHFIPQFYLKGFAKPRSKDGKLLVCDFKERRRFQTKPRNVAAQRDFNRVEADDFDQNIVESQLATVEAALDQGFRRVIDANSIASREDFASVLALIARLFIAHPRFRVQRDKLMTDVAKGLMQTMVATPERWAEAQEGVRADGVETSAVSYEEMREAVDQGWIEPRVNKDVLIAQEFELWPSILPLLEQRNWTLFVSNQATGDFATSDRPCTLRWSDPDISSGIFGPGLGVRDTSVIFPISRFLAIDGRFEEGGGVIQASRELVAAVNVATLASAMRQVYSAEDFPITDIDRTVRPFSQSELWLEKICKRPPDSDDPVRRPEPKPTTA